MNAALTARCPKCGAEPGQGCRSVKTGEPMTRQFRRTHKKRGWMVGSPSTAPLAVPVRVAVLKRRLRVGLVDSAAKTLR